jgi:hypothetical protein
LTSQYYVRSIPSGFRINAGGSIPVGAIMETPDGMERACCRGACCFIFASYTARQLVGIFVGIGSNRR